MSFATGKNLTHLDANGDARMVDVSTKQDTTRHACARGRVLMSRETLRPKRLSRHEHTTACASMSRGVLFCRHINHTGIAISIKMRQIFACRKAHSWVPVPCRSARVAASMFSSRMRLSPTRKVKIRDFSSLKQSA